MRAGIGDDIDLCDQSRGIDEEGHALRVVGMVFVRTAFGAVRAAYGAIDIGEQWESELLIPGERVVVGGCIE
jgi:hypothetical protein